MVLRGVVEDQGEEVDHLEVVVGAAVLLQPEMEEELGCSDQSTQFFP